MGWFSSKSDPKFFLSTVPPEPGRVSEYLGIVSGEAVIGANLFRDMFAAVRDVVGGRAGGYERALAGARQSALDEMVAAAREKGANGIVGIELKGGDVITSTISLNAISELGLEVGKEAYAVIKATSVMVGVDHHHC